MEAFTNGADLVFLLVCGEGGCRYYDGEKKIERNMEGIEVMLDDIGLEPERLLLSHADPYEEDPLARVLVESMTRAEQLSQNPYKPQIAEVVDGGSTRAQGFKPNPSKQGGA